MDEMHKSVLSNASALVLREVCNVSDGDLFELVDHFYQGSFAAMVHDAERWDQLSSSADLNRAAYVTVGVLCALNLPLDGSSTLASAARAVLQLARNSEAGLGTLDGTRAEKRGQ